LIDRATESTLRGNGVDIIAPQEDDDVTGRLQTASHFFNRVLFSNASGSEDGHRPSVVDQAFDFIEKGGRQPSIPCPTGSQG
jgi:hypothetical protein